MLHRNKTHRPLLAWLGLAALVGASAIPLAQAWRSENAEAESRPAPLPGASEALSTTRLVVDLRDSATPADIAELSQSMGISLRHQNLDARGKPLTGSNILVADIGPNQSMGDLIRRLKADSRVEAVEPDARFSIPEAQSFAAPAGPEVGTLVGPHTSPWRIVGDKSLGPIESRSHPALRKPRRGWRPNDELYRWQWNFEMVGAERAWKRARGAGVVVAVLDTGVAAKTSERGKQARDFGKTKFVDGFDFINGDDDPYDDHGHGTHVAGTIAESTNNREGAAGLAFEASIMPVKVLSGDGSGSTAGIADAIRWATDNGAQVINMSLGSPHPSEVMQKAVRYAARRNVLVVCAAGNGFGEPVGYPAGFKGALAVSSVGPSGDIAFYSSYGPQVALAAPGGDRQADPANGGVLQNTILQGEDDYFQFQGTSMASPHVAAVGALLMSQGVHDASRVRDLLLRSATARGPRLQYGAGILSADRATSQARRWGWASWAKGLVWMALVLPLAWKKPRSWWSPSAWKSLGTWWLRPVLAFAFWVGAFGPDWVAALAGANSPVNLLAFSALLPAILFWEWKDVRGSRIVMALSTGTALCLLASCWGGLLSPFTGTAMGWAVWPWTLANLFATASIGGAAWLRSQNSDV